MKRDLSEFEKKLFTKSNDIPDSPLFKNQADLASAMVALPNAVYKNEAVIRSLINQVILGRRSCPRKFAEAIICASISRVKDRQHHRTIKIGIGKEIELHNEGRRQSLHPYHHLIKTDVNEELELLYRLVALPREKRDKIIAAAKAYEQYLGSTEKEAAKS